MGEPEGLGFYQSYTRRNRWRNSHSGLQRHTDRYTLVASLFRGKMLTPSHLRNLLGLGTGLDKSTRAFS